MPELLGVSFVLALLSVTSSFLLGEAMNSNDAVFAQLATLGVEPGVAVRDFAAVAAQSSRVRPGFPLAIAGAGADLRADRIFRPQSRALHRGRHSGRVEGYHHSGLPDAALRAGRRQEEAQPYVNIATSLIIAGLLVSLSYAITRPLVMVSKLPTRNGIPLAVGLILIGVFVIISRRKALSQIVGFLVLENGIALLAALGPMAFR